MWLPPATQIFIPRSQLTEGGMARFESPCQIVSLFLTATLIAVLLIFLINAEVKHREEKENISDNDDGVTVTTGLRVIARKVLGVFR